MAIVTDTNGVSASASPTTTNGATSRFKVGVDKDDYDSRPSTAVGRKSGASPSDIKDDIDHDLPRRPVKPMLQRSKSDYVPRHQTDNDDTDDELQVWGARHGFEDHYQSEHIITQLASVSSPKKLLSATSAAAAAASHKMCRAQ